MNTSRLVTKQSQMGLSDLANKNAGAQLYFNIKKTPKFLVYVISHAIFGTYLTVKKKRETVYMELKYSWESCILSSNLNARKLRE